MCFLPVTKSYCWLQWTVQHISFLQSLGFFSWSCISLWKSWTFIHNFHHYLCLSPHTIMHKWRNTSSNLAFWLFNSTESFTSACFYDPQNSPVQGVGPALLPTHPTGIPFNLALSQIGFPAHTGNLLPLSSSTVIWGFLQLLLLFSKMLFCKSNPALMQGEPSPRAEQSMARRLKTALCASKIVGETALTPNSVSALSCSW